MKVSWNDATKTLSSLVHLNALPLLHTWLTPEVLAFSSQEKALTDAALSFRNTQPYPLGAFPLLI
jgi:hypothetical protein